MRSSADAILLSAERLGYSILSARKLATLDVPADIRARLADNLQAIEQGSRETLEAIEETFAKGRHVELPASQMAVFQPIRSATPAQSSSAITAGNGPSPSGL